MRFIEEENRIYAKDEKGKIIAEVDFTEVRQGVYNISHTFVDESLRGQGMASKLVEAAYNKITFMGKKVEASCSYAKIWLQRHEK